MGTSYYPITYQSINFPPVYTKTIEAAERTMEGTKGTRVRNRVDIYEKKNGDNYVKIGTSPIDRTYHFMIINDENILWTEFIKLDLYVNEPPMTMPSAGGKRKTRRNRKSNKTRKTFRKSKKGKKLIKSRKGKKMNKSRKRRKTYKKRN